MFTRQHYQEIARLIHKNYGLHLNHNEWASFISDLADYFQVDNERFDRDKFIHACCYGQKERVK